VIAKDVGNTIYDRIPLSASYKVIAQLSYK